jgi:hypothetical protein
MVGLLYPAAAPEERINKPSMDLARLTLTG